MVYTVRKTIRYKYRKEESNNTQKKSLINSVLYLNIIL